jgi:hypothetical protein
MTLADWGNYLTIIQVSIVVYKQWITASGKLRLMYWLMIVAGGLGAVSTTLLALAAPEVWGLLSTLVIMFWSMAMGVKGLMRLSVDDRYLKDITKAMESLDGSDQRVIEDLRSRGVPIWSINDEGKLVRTE